MSQDPEIFNLRRSDRRNPDGRAVWLFIGGSGQQAELKDISGEGACLIVPRPVSVNKPVRCQIGLGADLTEFEAIVVRCDANALGAYEVAIRFDASGIGVAARFAGRVSPTIHH